MSFFKQSGLTLEQYRQMVGEYELRKRIPPDRRSVTLAVQKPNEKKKKTISHKKQGEKQKDSVEKDTKISKKKGIAKKKLIRKKNNSLVQKDRQTPLKSIQKEPNSSIQDQKAPEPLPPQLPPSTPSPPPALESLVSLISCLAPTPQFIENAPTLHSLYLHLHSLGGVIHLASVGELYQEIRGFISEKGPKILQNQIQNIKGILFTLQLSQGIKQGHHGKNKIYQLGEVHFVSKQEFKDVLFDRGLGLTYFNHDLTLFQQGAQSLGIDEKIFNLDHMCEHYKKEKMDIRIQNPLDYGFKPSKLKNQKYEMTLGEYRFYQLNHMDPEKMKTFKHFDKLGKGQVFFGVNFEPSDQMLNREIKKNVNNTFLDFHGDFDLMSYLDKDIPGCSIPQMYFKTSGCWTGGHQQDINMSALNINHGPQASQWYTLDLKYIDRLRKQLIQNFNTDLYDAQGLWYEKMDWFITRGYPVKRFLQRKDDIVVTGPGTLHWVRCFGVAMQTSWNIFPKNYEQFAASFDRHKINKETNYWKRDVVPLKSLVKKYLNHQRRTMPKNSRLLIADKLSQWLKEQTDIVQQLLDRIDCKIQHYLRDLQSFCKVCRQQILIYFVAAPEHMNSGIQCLQCYMKGSNKQQRIQQLYLKHDIYAFNSLLEISKDECLNDFVEEEIQGICRGKHVGLLPNPCTVQIKLEANQGVSIDEEIQEFNDHRQLRTTQREVYKLEQNQFLSKLYINHFKIPQVVATNNKKRNKNKMHSKEKKVAKKMMTMGGNCTMFNSEVEKQEKISRNKSLPKKQNDDDEDSEKSLSKRKIQKKKTIKKDKKQINTSSKENKKKDRNQKNQQANIIEKHEYKNSDELNADDNEKKEEQINLNRDNTIPVREAQKEDDQNEINCSDYIDQECKEQFLEQNDEDNPSEQVHEQ